jgi:acyl-CoA synthetase (NDP forming)
MNATTGHCAAKRPPYEHRDLRKLIDPGSIAVVGASEAPGSFGARTLANIKAGYRGKVFPVNPKYDSIAGFKAYASLEDLPMIPDCVVIIVPMMQVEELVRRAADIGAGGVIIYSAGFAEVGRPDQIQAQQRIADISQATGIRVLGPNCVGIANLHSSLGLNFMPQFHEMPMIKGSIGLISQSGGLGYCVLQGMQRGIGFSHFLSTGNACDVDACDLINYLVDDDNTKVIACIFEGVRDGARFLAAAARALDAGKPLLVYKMANNDISRRTAMSHTGTVAGSVAAYRAAFDKTGVVAVDNWEELLEVAVLFSKSGAPSTHGIGVMASSGGAAVMAADKSDESGIVLPVPAPETSARLARVVPDFGSTANPCDLTAESLKSIEMYGDCIRAFADDPGFAAVVVPMMSAYSPTTVERARFLAELAEELSKPICLVWINEWLTGPGSEIYDAAPRISMFRSMQRCLKALKHWLTYHEKRPLLLRRLSSPAPGRDAKPASELLTQPGRRTLSERQSKLLLRSYGVNVTREHLARSASEAAELAGDIGYPIAMKVDSSDIPHKTEAGVVRLGIAHGKQACATYDELMRIAESLPGRPSVNGVLVQEMAGKGAELMIGVRRDPQFGPLIVCGFGGIDVELSQDVCVALAPISLEQARGMALGLKKSALLTGFRGQPALNVDDFADAICRVSRMAADHRDTIAEIDVNPYILNADKGMAVDALFVLASEEEQE